MRIHSESFKIVATGVIYRSGLPCSEPISHDHRRLFPPAEGNRAPRVGGVVINVYLGRSRHPWEGCEQLGDSVAITEFSSDVIRLGQHMVRMQPSCQPFAHHVNGSAARRVPAERNGIHILRGSPHMGQTTSQGHTRERPVLANTGEPLLSGSENQASVGDEGNGGIMGVAVDANDQIHCLISLPMGQPVLARRPAGS